MAGIGAVLVIGGGISGIQASIDLVNSGFKVFMVEKTSSIGGHMAQLDKTFPTNDCSMCILSPKMVDVGRDINIELITLADVEEIRGKAGNFEVIINKHPRYVDVDKCTGCRACTTECVLKERISSEYNEGLSKRGAAYISFPQAVPLKAAIDDKSCLFLTKGKCAQKCLEACKAGAIDFEQKEEKVHIHVGAIIVATGFDLLDSSQLKQYGYGRFKNVMTNMEFERLLSASGPTQGHIKRPSDGEEPEHIAFIQCVGSRDRRFKEYCSQVCCVASAKEAVIAKEHSPGVDTSIFFMDCRAFGKGFNEYVERVRDQYGVKFIKGRPGIINEDPETGDLLIHSEDIASNIIMETRADIVVLAPALIPHPSADGLAKVLGIQLDEDGFFKKSGKTPVETSRKGIFMTGFCQSPKDIPDSVAQASASASKAAGLLKDYRKSLISKEVVPPEKKSGEAPRIGAFICHCGINIGGVVDVPQVVEYAKTLPGVVYAKDNLFTCSDDTQLLIREAIEEHDLNRIVVASCSPRTHEPLFRSTCQKAGINPYFFEMTNIREHCSWVHKENVGEATQKAKDLVRMAVAKNSELESLKKGSAEVTPSSLVIGGGPAGLRASLDIANMGFKVYLVEKEDRLGGNLINLEYLADGQDPREVLKNLVQQVEDNENIDIYLNSKISGSSGSVGHFLIGIDTDGKTEEIQVGTVLVATGAKELKPFGMHGYGDHPTVVTSHEFEKILNSGGKISNKSRIAFLQCAGSRGGKVSYCSRTCCLETIKNVIRIKTDFPEARVNVLFRDMMTFGKYETLFTKAREMGVKFSNYDINRPISVGKKEGKLHIDTFSQYSGQYESVNPDFLVLSTPMVPLDENAEVSQILKIPLDSNGFFLEAHTKLRPLDFSTEGIFLCGACQGPKELDAVFSQASGAASRAGAILSKDSIETEAMISGINLDYCKGCGICATVCPVGSIEMEQNGYKKVPIINSVTCKGCGKCASNCPSGAIQLRGFKMRQMIAQIDSVLEGENE